MKRTMTAMLALCLAAGLVLPASALEYTIDAPDGPDYPHHRTDPDHEDLGRLQLHERLACRHPNP